MRKLLLGTANNITENINKVKLWHDSFKKVCDGDVMLIVPGLTDEDIKLLVKTVETNPRYKNLLFMTMHYIDSPNFFTFNIFIYNSPFKATNDPSGALFIILTQPADPCVPLTF